VKLRRLATGVYATLDGRYQVEAQVNWTECDHPLCDQLHERFIYRGMHDVPYTVWIVWDVEYGGYVENHHTFDTKRDAVAWLENYLERTA
jgi:hypothetical protein